MAKTNNYFYITSKKDIVDLQIPRLPKEEYIFIVGKEIVAKLEFGIIKNKYYAILKYGINKTIISYSYLNKSYRDTIMGLFYNNSSYGMINTYKERLLNIKLDLNSNIWIAIIIDFLRYINIRKIIDIHIYSDSGLLHIDSMYNDFKIIQDVT